MALDRFVDFKTGAPGRTTIAICLRDYVGGMGVVTWDGERFFAAFPGKPSYAFQHVGPATDAEREGWEQAEKARCNAVPLTVPLERWFEVLCDTHRIDVITRSADDITNAVAEGFAAVLARGWGGTVYLDGDRK